jgi:hypothetical protein
MQVAQDQDQYVAMADLLLGRIEGLDGAMAEEGQRCELIGEAFQAVENGVALAYQIAVSAADEYVEGLIHGIPWFP